MALGLSTTLRNNMLDELTALVDAGTDGLLSLYDGTQPATGGTVTTLLSQHNMSATSFAAATGGTATANAIDDDTSANATGTCTWFRITDSAGTFVCDGTVGASGSGADLILSTTTITSTLNVAIDSLVLTAGNA